MEYNEFNEMERYGGSVNQNLTYEDVERIAASKVRGSLLWMVLGLVISGITGFVTLTLLYSGILPTWIIIAAFVAEFIVVVAFSALIYKSSVAVLRLLFIVYSALTGVTLCMIGIMYSLDVILYAFIGTVVLFTTLAIYGYVTKEDLSKYRTILMVGLLALVAMAIINMFLRSDGLMWVSSMLGIVVFIIFTAYDVNRIKNSIIEHALYEDASILDRIEIHGALSLYLDFVNMFIYLLRILGRRK